MSRNAVTEAAYQAAKQAYRSVEDSVRITVFHWEKRMDADGRWVAVRPTGGGWRRRAFVPNAFPYLGLRPNEEHWVLWSETPMERDAVAAYLTRHMPTGLTLRRWWRNPEWRQSVRGIWHVQVNLTRVTG